MKKPQFKKGQRVVTDTGTHALIYKVLRGGNAGWYELATADYPYNQTAQEVNLQVFGAASWHGDWRGPR